jgi:formyltetrahydrofolate deformylase
LRLCLSGVAYEFKARDIVANAIGRYLLNIARAGTFASSPVVVIVDEAHNFLGRHIGGEDSVARLDAFELIAKEGRKYGLNICLATQRPRDITEGVLSQMGTLVVHRLTNERDREVVERACGEIDRSASSFLPSLKPGEAAIIGADFPIPLTIQIFPPEVQPKSDGPNYQMHWQLKLSKKPIRLAIMVSQYDHCLADLLHRYKNNELQCEIPLIISNHLDAQKLAEFYGIPFFHIPVEKDKKKEAEAEQFTLFDKFQVDFIVLARYMQILSEDFVKRYPQRVINIHHSFLPAFIGARPYHRAFERGVKLIGATSHYVTEVLDEGPIIEQDIDRISHRDQVEDLIQKGRDLERIVLSKAVRWHIENRILIYSNKTVIFD